MPRINFFEEDLVFKLKDKSKVRGWLIDTIKAENYSLKELNYVFCSDPYLLQINQQYLNHDTYTDIVTFDNSDVHKVIIGDIFISIDRIKDNAEKFETGLVNELHRVIIHGALHLMGYTDKKVTDKKLMTTKEDHYLSKRNFTITR